MADRLQNSGYVGANHYRATIMPNLTESYDITVIGGGNTDFFAVLTAAGMGAGTVILETTPKPFRAGNYIPERPLPK